jgi:NCAIR mutase (PurE)-related protein
MGDSTAPDEHSVVGRLAAGAADLKMAVETELGCQVAGHKSALIASSDRLLDRCQRAFGRFAGTSSSSASNLGVGIFAGR